MSSRRTAILVGAIAVGIAAVVLIWQYVRGVENDLVADSSPVPVFIAGSPIARGTAGEAAVSDKSVVQGSIPQKFYPATAITSADEVQKKVALFEISPGTIIVRGMFVDQATTQISFRERLKNKNHVAITVQIDQVRGVGGFLVPGDEVNIMVMTKTEVENFSPARMLYQKVQILAVGQTQLLSPGEQAAKSDTGAAPSSGSGMLTFNVPVKAAQMLVSFDSGTYYLTLVPKDYTPEPVAPLTPEDVKTLPGENPAQLCPYFDTRNDSGCAKAG